MLHSEGSTAVYNTTRNTSQFCADKPMEQLLEQFRYFRFTPSLTRARVPPQMCLLPYTDIYMCQYKGYSCAAVIFYRAG